LDTFLEWFRALSPRSFCLPCLAKIYEKPEASIRAALDPLREGLTKRFTECWCCGEGRVTYTVTVDPADRPCDQQPAFDERVRRADDDA
jgi:hypothetical protein